MGEGEGRVEGGGRRGLKEEEEGGLREEGEGGCGRGD